MTTAPPQLSLTAAPARVQFAGAGTQVVQLRNAGRTPVVVDVRRAGFALDLRGAPRVIAAAPSGWLSASPVTVSVPAQGTASVTVRARVPRGAFPGDHPGLLLFATRPVLHAGLAVRMRLGVVVVLRAPGRIVHRIAVEALRLRRRGRLRTLILRLANRGNVTEVLGAKRLTVTLWRRGREVGQLHPATRELLPRSRGVVELPYRGVLRGHLTARVELGRLVRSFPLRL